MNSPWTGNLEWESMLRSEGETRRLVEKPLQTSAVMAAEVMNTDEPNLLSLFLALLYIYILLECNVEVVCGQTMGYSSSFSISQQDESCCLLVRLQRSDCYGNPQHRSFATTTTTTTTTPTSGAAIAPLPPLLLPLGLKGFRV